MKKTSFSIRIRKCATEVGQGGACALGKLYDLTAPRLVRYAHMLTRNREDAEDALQAAMVRIALNPRVLANARYPWAYFLKIVRNEALNIVRRKKPAQLLSCCTAVWTDETHLLETADLNQQVQIALRKLPPSQSEVVVLKIWEEMTFAEIGEVLGQSPNTAASRYRYALSKLSQHLQPFADEVLYD